MLDHSRVCLGNCCHGINARLEVSIFIAPGAISPPSEVRVKAALPRLRWAVAGMFVPPHTGLNKATSAHGLSRRRAQTQCCPNGLQRITVSEN